jgi:hypothetical protein
MTKKKRLGKDFFVNKVLIICCVRVDHHSKEAIAGDSRAYPEERMHRAAGEVQMEDWANASNLPVTEPSAPPYDLVVSYSTK